ncbi:MAG: class I SAM-dependent methyltransferase [Flavitalea sp.]
MEHSDVAQAQLLNRLTRDYLIKHKPDAALFLGISGGNGLEHIDPGISRVCGVDINQSYLDIAQNRFNIKLPQLELFQANIETSTDSFIRADFIWAALILEYVNIDRAFRFISHNCKENCVLILTIQSNNGATSVSNTGITSLQSVKGIFREVEDPILIQIATNSQFTLIDRIESELPNGKSFITYEFRRSTK